MNWLNNINFRFKMAIPNTVIIIIFIIVLSFIYRTFSVQIEINNRLLNEIQPVLNKFDDGYRDMYQMIAAAQQVVLFNNDNQVLKQQQKEYEDNANKVIPRLSSVESLIEKEVVAGSLDNELANLVSAFKKWRAHYDQVFVNPLNANSYINNNQVSMDKQFSIVRAKLKIITKAVEQEQKALRKKSAEATQSATSVIIAGGFIAIVAAFSLGYFFSGLLLSPIKKLHKAMSDIATGEGDLTQRINIEAKDEVGELASTFNVFVEKIQHIVTEVAASSNSVQSSVIRLYESTEDVSRSTTAQSEESTAIAASVHELSTTSEHVKNDAEEAANASNLASNDAMLVKQTLAVTVQSIGALAEELQNASDVITHLEHDVGNIVSILEVIRGIADQTNLLALNAAIEAARAGEQGRGFAVVADEVRSLASKTQESTGEIQQMIEKLQHGTSSAVNAMTMSKSTSTNTANEAQKANDSIIAITQSIDVITQMNNQIAQAALEQSQVSETINMTIRDIADRGADTVAKVTQASTECGALSDESNRLEHLVKQFKV